jgi:fructose-1-phosphate kinase PfkB-like protein
MRQVSDEDEAALLSMIRTACYSSEARVRGLAIMGSLPPGVSPDFYAKVPPIS